MRVVLAGGGTTGHISPMLATAEALVAHDPSIDITCVGTPVGLETDLVPANGFELALVDPVPLPRSISVDLVTLPVRILKAVRQAKAICRGADVVVGFGGYASLPVFLAAHQMKIPVVVHEANAVPGLANRIGARFAAYVCVTFANTGLSRQIVTGMPVRPEVANLDRAGERAPAREIFGLDPDATVVLVSGGSQGAKSLNEATMGALPALVEAGISVLHVTGKKNFDVLPDPGLKGYVRVAYVERMDQAYAAADLMVARSGAGTVTETALAGLPVIFVPLPHGNGEQAKNAAGVVAAGGGILIDDADLTSERLAHEAIRILSDDTMLAAMSEAAIHVMPRDAAQAVARYALDAAGERRQ